MGHLWRPGYGVYVFVGRPSEKVAKKFINLCVLNS